MNSNTQITPSASSQDQAKFQEGKWTGVAICALAVACIAPLNLLGLEKVILCMTLGILTVRNTKPGTRHHKFGFVAVGVASLMVLTWIFLIANYNSYRDQLQILIETLSKLG